MISCHIHDYVEIACLYRIKIKLAFIDGNSIIGSGKTTLYNKNKEECLLLQTEKGDIEVVLTKIKMMTACDDNPHFKSVSF